MPMVPRAEMQEGRNDRYSNNSSNYSSSSSTPPSYIETHFPRLRHKFEAVIRSDIVEFHANTVAVSWPLERLGNPPNQLPSWDDMGSIVNDRRIEAVEKILNELIPLNGNPPLNDEPKKAVLLRKLDVLLGPNTMAAQSEAAQNFLCPERQLYRQLYWGVLTLLQQDFQQILREKGEQRAWEYVKQSSSTQKKLRILLEAIRENLCQQFSFLDKVAGDFFKDLFSGDKLNISWMELLERTYQGLKNQPLLSPDTYTQEAMENLMMDWEIRDYQQRTVKYLMEYPQEISLFSDLLQVDFKEGSTLEKNIEDIAVSMASLPSRLPLACSEHFLKRDWFTHPLVVKYLMSRGAPLIHAANIGIHQGPIVWQLLQLALNSYRPKDPVDEAFRQQLFKYAENTKRDLERWSSVMVALWEAQQQSTSLVSVLYPQLLLKEARYWKNSSLFKLSETWSTYESNLSLGSVLLAFSDWRKLKPVVQSTTNLDTVLPLKQQLTILTTVTSSSFSARWQRFVAEKPAHLTTLEADHVSFAVDPDKPNYRKLDALLSYCYTSPFTTLTLVNTELSDNSVHRLFKKRLPTVQHLVFKQNLLTDKGLRLIAEELPYWPALTTLDLSDNLITDQGVQFLLDALPHSSLMAIIFGDNPAVSEEIRENIHDQLTENRLQPLEKDTSRFSVFDSPRLLPREKKPAVILTQEEQAAQEAAALLAAFEITDATPQDSPELMQGLSTPDDEMRQAHLWIATLPQGSQAPTTLNLSRQQLQNREIPFSLLIAYLSTCEPTFEVINFEGQFFKDLNEADFERLVSLFSRFSQLKGLNFDNTWLSSLQEKPLNNTPENQRKIPKTAKLSLLVKHLSHCPALQALFLRGTGNWFGKEDYLDLITLVKAKPTLLMVSLNEDAGTPDKQNQLKKALQTDRIYPESMRMAQRQRFEITSLLRQIPVFSQLIHSWRPSESQSSVLSSGLEQPTDLTVSVPYVSSLIPRPKNTLSLKKHTQPASYAKWHTLVPFYGDELIFQFSDEAKIYFDLQHTYFIENPGSHQKQDSELKTVPYSPQEIYYDVFYNRFLGLMKACEIGPTEMVKMQEGILGKTVQAISVPIEMISPSILSALQFITEPLDEQERQAYYESVSSAIGILERSGCEKKKFTQFIALLLTQQYTYRTHLLTKEQAKNDAAQALNWLAYAHYEHKDPLIVKGGSDHTISIRRVDVLMTLVFGYEESLLIAIPRSRLADYQHLIEMPKVYSIVSKGSAILHFENVTPLPDLPIIPKPTSVYQDSRITDPKLRRFEQFIRRVVTITIKNYQKEFKHSLGYYERFFMPLLLGHGGKLSIEDCNKLNIASKNLPFPEFLNYLHTELNPNNSGFREPSAQVRLIEGLMQPVHSMKKNTVDQKTAFKQYVPKNMVRQSRSVSFFEEQQRQNQRVIQRKKFAKVTKILEETLITQNKLK